MVLRYQRLLYAFGGALILSLSACAPSVSPLYRDYEVQDPNRSVTARIEAALDETGWQRVPGSTPNIIATDERKVKSWGIYSIVVSLEVAPVGEEYVRLYFHPYRKYFTGSRSKIPFLQKSLQRALLQDLNDAFEQQGFVALGTGIERDRQAATH